MAGGSSSAAQASPSIAMVGGSSSSVGSTGSLPSIFRQQIDRMTQGAATTGSSSSTTTTTGPSASVLPATAAASREEKILRAVEREIERSYAAKRSSSSCPSPLRQLVHKGAKKSPSPSKKPSSPAPPSPEARRRAAAAASASGTASKNSPRASTEEERVPAPAPAPVRQGAALSRSCYAAAMRSALARIQGGDAGGSNGDGEEFGEMEQAMKGLMDVSFRKEKSPATPSSFLSRCPRSDECQFRRDVIADPVILPSGDTIDKFSHHWFTRGADEPSLAAPNHLLRDAIAAWCHDHSILLPSPAAAIGEAAPPPPSEEEMPLLLEKLSGHSVQQQEALHMIRVLSRSTQGAQPCLGRWPELLPKLMQLHKKWKASWSTELEEERLAVVLNLALDGPNREILAAHEPLPDALRRAVRRAKKLGSPRATMAMAAGVVAALSEVGAFRLKAVGAGGLLPLLRGLLAVEDAVVRNEACAAMLALCCAGDAAVDAELGRAAEALMRCVADGMASEECLVLLERAVVQCGGGVAPESWTEAHVARLVAGVVKLEGASLTRRGVESAVGLVYSAIQRDAAMLRKAEKLEEFLDALRKLQSKVALGRSFQIEEIVSAAAAAPLPVSAMQADT